MRISIDTPDLDFSTLEAETTRALDETIKGAVQLVANDAKQRVARGPKSGNIYTHFFRSKNGTVFPVEKRGAPHQASAPGEAPATDTGRLLNSISADGSFDGTKFEGYVRADVDYARYLEFGTSKILPRPFLIPSVEANRQRIADMIRIASATAAGAWARKMRG